MHRIVILDFDQPLRGHLTEALRCAANTEVVVAADADELISRVSRGGCAAAFVDGDLLDGDTSRLIAAVKSSLTRPMLVIASNQKAADLDPEFVTLVVRKPYDLLTLTGVLLSAVIHVPGSRADSTDSPPAN